MLVSIISFLVINVSKARSLYLKQNTTMPALVSLSNFIFDRKILTLTYTPASKSTPFQRKARMVKCIIYVNKWMASVAGFGQNLDYAAKHH
jgi:hypothetical protein